MLRIGRTKAYAMAKEWRASGGRSGLPVVDLGSVLRVPQRALDQLIDAALIPFQAAATKVCPEPADDAVHHAPAPRRRSIRRPQHQPGLFDLPPAS